MSKVAAALVAVVGVLQASLTAVGANNGGLATVVLNKPNWAWTGLGLVALAMLILGLYAIFDGTGPLWKLAGVIGVLAIVGGVSIAGYAALAAPAVNGEPHIDASLTWGKPMVLQTTAQASAINRMDVFHIEVVGLDENKLNHSYKFKAPVLYQAQLGADGAGSIDTSFTIPIPSGRYEDIGISAWNGENHDPCGQLRRPRTTTSSVNVNTFSRSKGCVVVHVAGLPGSAVPSEP